MSLRGGPALRRDSILQWLSERYHRAFVIARELALYGLYWAVALVIGWVVGRAWGRAWVKEPPGLSRGVATVVTAPLPGVEPTVILLGGFAVLLGMASSVLLDPYKRVEGLPAVGGVLAAGIAAAPVVGITTTPTALEAVVLALGVVTGLRATRAIGGAGNPKSEQLRKRLARFRLVAVGVVAFGVLEANTQYPLPFDLPAGSSTPSGAPAAGAAVSVPEGAALTTFLEFALVPVLWVLLGLLFTYESNRDLLILGPQRAGKTWLIGGLAYSLRRQAGESSVGASTELNEPFEGPDGLYNKFKNERFDEIRPTKRGEGTVYTISFPNGWIFRRKTTLRLLDYAGDLYQDLEPGAVPDDHFNLENGLRESKVVEEISERLNEEARPGTEKVKQAMNVLLFHATTVGLVIPTDDTVDHLSEFPSWISKEKDVDKYRDSGYMETHGQVLETYAASKNVFFLVTMTDFLYDAFPGRPRGDRPGFRRFVHETVAENHPSIEDVAGHFSTDLITPSRDGVLDRITGENPFVPVYLEPSAGGDTDGHTPAIDNPGFRGYLLFGLRYLLRRVRR